ncbi:MAG: A/G-specific adenine glycosylase [Lentilactobacillus hilgardii]|uniref:A/G-specific adenine glycosylase n=1 Tax=Lentilactobacillus hilgardii TaxID=1588 RepID=UPI001CC1EFBD|nr:A/G-specific adenine glycosylase [Lentilactobacillus hilgardii]MBZ2202454.1 A/G-specific adenine glycosylase [Lentilactobacillus hilgardii]MBZ2205419.1 A/G-specific adenine glycosylase [Lentilactobacillus hilgardii]
MVEWTPEKIVAFQETLLKWYDNNKRNLPWRRDHDPYHVWISEIMLQQTQVQTVIPYYERFMKLFPTVQALANADEAILMKAWEGLGYYSRARNLQKAAQQIVNDYNGQWPTTVKELQELSGIGPYTAGAIASIAFNKPVPAVDGNALRVFARLLEIDEDIAKPQTRKLFENIIKKLMPKNRPGDFNQAIMDLGASYMSAKNYDSENSPVKLFNQAYLDGVEDNYPVKTKKKRLIPVNYFGLLIHSQDDYLFERRPSSGILSRFWMFPLIKGDDIQTKKDASEDDVLRALEAQFLSTYQLEIHVKKIGGRPVTHTFTHQKWQITLLEAELNNSSDLSYFPGKWISESDFREIAFTKVQTKMWERYQQQKEQ